jgi:hypothetical protein
MSLAERRLAVKAELDKAKRAHRSTRALQREFEILTAGILADQMRSKRDVNKGLPAEAWLPCYLARPDLWEAFCRLQGRPNEPSEHWTTWDVVMLLTRKLLEASQTADGTPALPH